MVSKKFLSWGNIEDLVKTLLGKVPKDTDALLVVTRGGMVPACLISEKADIRNILVAAVMFYTDVGQTMDAPRFLQFPPDPYLAGKDVLIVDDVWDSGRTVKSVKQRVLAAGGRPRVAVLHWKPERSLYPEDRPEYYAEETDDWIVYPWDPDREKLLEEEGITDDSARLS
jgi:hypoxanthine phosphoribosyltransferase